MATLTFKGIPAHTAGELPTVGQKAPKFALVGKELKTYTNTDFEGNFLVLNIFPSLDTAVCATSVRRFNKEVVSYTNVKVLAISKDLPFAMGRFCSTEGIEEVIPLSGFRTNDFGTAFGVELTDTPLEGLYARAIIVIDPAGKVIHTELVDDIVHEPNYETALAIVGKATEGTLFF